ncbi:MAG: M14 family metallopeptidase [Marinoscillum sp.]
MYRTPLLFSFILLICVSMSWAQVQSPAEFLGYELGDQFTRHHQVVDYFKQVSGNSDQVILEQYGETYEKRPLYLAYVSSAKNLANIESIRQDNLKRAGIISGAPASSVNIVWLSYNVHGNESVSTEASMATIYELVREGGRNEWLRNTIVIIDPCINPDGRERYVNFYWEHVNTPYNPDPNSWEHHESWPGGRANHYLFDLNRDWAWQTQIETKARLKKYNQWLPQVHVDFHEQGVNSPYYFAPAAEPYHELITKWQIDFQTEIGKNHAKYFDENNWLYFTKQVFDLLYPSYGDTYPTYSGAIGMTYEQGGSGRAGLGIIKQEEDTLTLKDRIAHHYTTGLSTVEVASENSDLLLSEFSKFFKTPARTTYKSYVLKATDDKAKTRDLLSWLDAQGIQYGKSSYNKTLTGYHYGSGSQKSFNIGSNDIVININQPKSVLASVLFEPKTTLSDSLTYDITSWAVPYFFGIEAYATTTDVRPNNELIIEPFNSQSLQSSYGFIFPWENLNDARLLASLLKKGIRLRYTTKPVTIASTAFDRGSIIVTGRDNPVNYISILEEEANKLQVQLYTINSGFVMDGPDIGSNDHQYLRAPKIALIGGDGTSSLDYGATWHFMEQDLGYPVTTISTDYFNRVNLSDYDVLIMQDGRYSSFDNDDLSKIKSWVSEGGTLIAVQGAIDQLKKAGVGSISEFNSDLEKTIHEELDKSVTEELKLVPFDDLRRYQIREFVAGAVFNVTMDNTHPLAYGYDKNYYSLKTNGQRFGYLESGNVGVIKSNTAHLSGFAGEQVLKKIDRSLVFGVEDLGRGNIVYMVDNPLFRSFWYGGKLLFANSLFFVGQ